jgi:hypothetical protein
VKKLQQKKDREMILGLLSSGEGRAFLAKGVAKMYGCQAAKKKRIGEIFKSWMPGVFVKGKCFGTPLYTTCKSEQGWR